MLSLKAMATGLIRQDDYQASVVWPEFCKFKWGHFRWLNGARGNRPFLGNSKKGLYALKSPGLLFMGCCSKFE